MSSLEVVEAHIAQIQRVNPVINAVVQTQFDQAREEAKLADQQLQKRTRKRLPPFK